MVGVGRTCWIAGATTVFLALVVLVATPSQTRSAEDLAALNKQVGQLYRQGKYGEAIPIAERGLAGAEDRFGANNIKVGITLNTLAALYDKNRRLLGLPILGFAGGRRA